MQIRIRQGWRRSSFKLKHEPERDPSPSAVELGFDVVKPPNHHYTDTVADSSNHVHVRDPFKLALACDRV